MYCPGAGQVVWSVMYCPCPGAGQVVRSVMYCPCPGAGQVVRSVMYCPCPGAVQGGIGSTDHQLTKGKEIGGGGESKTRKIKRCALGAVRNGKKRWESKGGWGANFECR